MINEMSLAVLDLAIKKWLAKKYGLLGIDESGCGVYTTHPDDWQEGDLPMIEAWEYWKHTGDKRTNDDLQTWYMICEARKVDLSATQHMTVREKSDRKAMLVVGAGLALGTAYYLFAPPSHGVPVQTTEDIQRQLTNIFDGVFARGPRQSGARGARESGPSGGETG